MVRRMAFSAIALIACSCDFGVLAFHAARRDQRLEAVGSKPTNESRTALSTQSSQSSVADLGITTLALKDMDSAELQAAGGLCPHDPSPSMNPFKNFGDKICGQVYEPIHEDTQVQARIFGWFFVFFAALAFAYEMRFPCEESRGGESSARWDFIKCILCGLVVVLHMSQLARKHMPIWWGVPVAIPGFVLVSGLMVSGHSFNTKFVAETAIGIPLAIIGCGFLVSVVSWITPGNPFTEFGLSIVDWYLYALMVWRLSVNPIMDLATRLRVPRAVPFVFVYLVSYFTWYTAFEFESSAIYRGSRSKIQALLYPWRLWTFHAPMYALGMLLSKDDWANLLWSRPVPWLANVGVFLYFFLTSHFVSFEQWLDVACRDHLQCAWVWYPASVMVHGVSLSTFATYTRVFLQKATLCLMFMAASGSWLRVFQTIWPRFASMAVGCGKRSIFIYLLHWAVFIVPATRTGFWRLQVVDNFHNHYLLLGVGVFLNTVLGSRLAEVIFGPVLVGAGWRHLVLGGGAEKNARFGNAEASPETCNNQSYSSSPVASDSATRDTAEGCKGS